MKSALIVESDCWSDSVSGQVGDMDDKTVGERLGRLELSVDHIQTDISDIKVELRRTNDRLDKLIEDVGGKERRLDDKIDGVEKRLDARIDGVKYQLIDKIDRLREEMASMKVWAIGLYVGMSGSLLLVMAKGFKWI